MNGGFENYVPGHDLLGYFLYNDCDDYNVTKLVSANQSMPNTSGNGTIPPTIVANLSAGQLYCYQACVVDLDANATRGDPVGPVCGNTVKFYWANAVSKISC